jgi:hypothetical protein
MGIYVLYDQFEQRLVILAQEKTHIVTQLLATTDRIRGELVTRPAN